MKKRIFGLVVILAILIFVIELSLLYRTNIAPKTNLETTVNKALDGAKGNYTILIKNLKTNESYSYSSHKIFQIGSLYKLWVMAEAFNQMQKGILKEDEELSGNIATLNNDFDIDSNSAELTEGHINLSVSDALKQMISISHNYAALLLVEKLEKQNIKLFLEKNDFKESRISDEQPLSSAYDIGLFLEKLYKVQLAKEEYSKKMLDLLKTQQLNDKLSKYLPKEVVVAHKTGEIDFLSHDAGIVYSKKGDYILVVLSESDYPPGAKERIAQISKAVYDYFVR